MTEQYIPIGQSPGLSGKYTVIGKLQSVNAKEQTCTVAGHHGRLERQDHCADEDLAGQEQASAA